MARVDVSAAEEARPARSRFEAFIPKSIVCVREGYGRQFFLQDLFAGLTVGVIALPLAMAFAIGSGEGIRPEQGLYTAIIAGFIIAALGGSRVSVAGPTGAFMPILFLIVARHGYQGLAIASVMAGMLLILMGLLKLGSLIKFIPYPVTTGFTTGIAVIIFSQQIKDLFGLPIEKVPVEFFEKWRAYFEHFSLFGRTTAVVGVGSLLVIILLRKLAPKVPGAIVVVVLAAVAVSVLGLDQGGGVATIESRFGGIPRGLPTPVLPDFSQLSILGVLAKARDLIPEATTIALLAAIESLLCCVVADGMIGGRHKSNCELVAQGIGNIGSILFGGLPATGAIARTAANVKAGARTPLAGMIHSVFVLVVMLLLAPYAGKIPLATLAAVLVMVAYNMSELDHFRTLLRAPKSDIAVLLATFLLTVLTDLTVAVGFGMVMASLLFMKRMSEVTNIGNIADQGEEEEGRRDIGDISDPQSIARRDVPAGVEVYEINGPFFFGAADLLGDTLRSLERPPKVFILRMRRVPAVDATGLHALDEFHHKCRRQGTRLLLAGVHAQPIFAMQKYGLIEKFGEENLYGDIDSALNRARELLGLTPLPQPADAAPEVSRRPTQTP
jgi:SulP family sulfate permease